MRPRQWIWAALSGLAVAALAQAAPSNSPALLNAGAPSWVLPGAAIDFDFLRGRYFHQGASNDPAQLITTSRASTETSLLPTSPAGASYITFGNNVPAIVPGLGVQSYEGRTNLLLNSTAPVTQTTGSLANGNYTLWVNGSGSATMSAGTGTGCGTGVASQGSPVSFTTSGTAGTCVVTVSGSLNAFQLELGAFGTPLIVTAGSTLARAADVMTVTKVPTFGTSYTLFFKGTAASSAPNFQGGLNVSDGTTNNRAQIIRNSGQAGNYALLVGGSSIFNVGGAGISWANSTRRAGALAVGPNDQAAFENGASIGIATNAGIPSIPSVITVGGIAGTSLPWNSYVERIAIWPSTRLPNAALQTLTSAGFAANDNGERFAANDDDLILPHDIPRRQIWAEPGR